jgi:hypothetical protein
VKLQNHGHHDDPSDDDNLKNHRWRYKTVYYTITGPLLRIRSVLRLKRTSSNKGKGDRYIYYTIYLQGREREREGERELSFKNQWDSKCVVVG